MEEEIQTLLTITVDSETFDSEEVAASVTVLISTVDEVKGNISVRTLFTWFSGCLIK